MRKYVKKADRPNLPQRVGLKHGIYAGVVTQEAILTRHPEIMTYLGAVRRGYIRDLSPEGEAHMTTAKHVILDRLMGKMKMAGLIEAYLSENGIIRRDKLALKILDPEPITTLWLALNHQIRLDIQLLGLERKAMDVTLTPAELLLEVAKDYEREEAEKRATSPVEGKPSETPDIVAGVSGDVTGGEKMP